MLLLLPLCSAAACCFSCFMNENQPLSDRRVCLPAAQLDGLGAARRRRDNTAVILMMEGLTEWVFVCVLLRSARACLLSYKWREIIDSALRMLLLIRRAVTQYPPVVAAEARACMSRTTTHTIYWQQQAVACLHDESGDTYINKPALRACWPACDTVVIAASGRWRMMMMMMVVMN